jgi:putative ABC transport system permease protein
MSPLRILLSKFSGLFHRRRLEQQLDEDVRAHIEMLTDENLRKGMEPEEARYAALRQFGNVSSMKEECRERWSTRIIEELIQDVRYGLRQLRRNPGFTAVAVLTLALGIGGTTAIFNVVYSVLLHPLPYKDADRLAVVFTHDPKRPQSDDWAMVTPAEFLDYQEQNHVFDGVAGCVEDDMLMTGPNISPEWFWGARVTPNTFQVLGMSPILGRTFTAADVKPGAPTVVVLSYKVWQKDFGGKPGIVGHTIFLNHQSTMVVGVMPPQFDYDIGASGWLPAAFSRVVPKDPNQLTWVMGRLRPGVTVAQAASDIAFLSKRFAAAYPKQHPKGVTFSAKSLGGPGMDPQTRSTLGMLMAGVGLLLLIACVNVANLLLARASNREHEISIRAAIGAGRVRLVRQLLIESLLLAAGGAVFGTLIAWNVYTAVVSILPPQYMFSEAQVRMSAMNGWVLLFAVGIALASTVLFGLAPAVLAVEKDLQAPLKGSGRGTGETRGHHRVRNLLVVSEVVLSLVLLSGAGLLFRSFWTLRHIKLGYTIDNVLQAEAMLPQKRYKTLEQKNQFHLEVLRRVRSLPGVASATLVWPNINRVTWVPIEIHGQAGASTGGLWARFVGDGFFATMGIPLLQGRTFSEDDMYAARPVMVVNRAFVDQYFADVNPLGRQINVKKSDWFPQLKHGAYEIVGVVADTVHAFGFDPDVKPQIFLPFIVSGMWWSTLYIRAAGYPANLTKPVLKAFSTVDKELPADVVPVRDDFKDWYTQPRFVTGLLVGFALLGMVLACIGVYGVLSYAVSQRTQEIGVRMALGAQVADVRRMVLKTGLRWLLIGIGIGIPASIALEKILQNRIWGIKSADPLTLAAVSLVLIAVGLAACYFPARRASKVDPMVALRYE